MQTDPIGYSGGINLYAYVGNDPLNLLDPFGFSPDSPSYGQSLLQGTVNAVLGAYYSGLAQQQFQQGNYGAAAVYGTASIADAALGVATLGLSTRVGTAVRAVETLSPAAERATEIANTLGRSQNFITIGVTDTAEGVRIISSSENALRPAALDALTGGEIAVTGPWPCRSYWNQRGARLGSDSDRYSCQPTDMSNLRAVSSEPRRFAS